jgi:type VI secretion system protein ImpH
MDAMAAPARRANAVVKQSLPEQVLETPEAFDLDQLIYIIESLRTTVAPLGEATNPQKEAVRLRSPITMHQEGTEVNRLEVKNTLSKVPEIYINTLSLAGVNGPLPTPYTEKLLEQMKQKDFAGAHFLDIFHHRLASMWHRLRKRTYPHLFKSPPAQTPIGKLQENLSGFAQQGDVDHTLFFDHFWKRSRSLAGLLQMVKTFFGVEASISPFEGAWRKVDAAEGSRIGKRGQFQVLGKDAILGLRCWDQAAGFTIEVAPLDWEALQGFLPFKSNALGGGNFYKLKQLVVSYMGTLPRVFLKLSLKEGENRGASLDHNHGLGWNTWLSGATAESVRVRV